MKSPRPASSVKPIIPQPPAEEVVALALNEQGYLLHHKVASALRASNQDRRVLHNWRVESCELPVSLPDGNETRVDILLRHRGSPGIPWRVVLECKRAARDYKRWVFFGECTDKSLLSRAHYRVARADLATREMSRDPYGNYQVARTDLAGAWDNKGEPELWHSLESRAATDDCRIFDFGVEARLDRPGSGKRASATDAIEDAFQQVTLGQAGLVLRLVKMRVLNFRLVPVVLTTAELLSAQFDLSRIALDRGVINEKEIRLKPLKWLAVNYPVSDLVCQYSGIATIRPDSAETDLMALRTWTVFVVQAEYIQTFLAWLEKTFLRNSG
jgi:hypothetical protein